MRSLIWPIWIGLFLGINSTCLRAARGDFARLHGFITKIEIMLINPLDPLDLVSKVFNLIRN